MRVGVLGVGRFGVHHAETLADHPGVADLVLTDADTDRAREAAHRLHVHDFDILRAVTGRDVVEGYAVLVAGIEREIQVTPHHRPLGQGDVGS